MNISFRIFLTLSALFLFVSLYFIKNKIVLIEFFPDYVNYIIYAALPFIFCCIALHFCEKLGSGNLGKVLFIEVCNNNFLSNYLAFFFVAVSLTDWMTFFFCFGLTALFTFYSRVSYFNPILIVYGYNFYYVTLDNNSKILLISKKTIKSPEDVNADQRYKRINDYTFIG